MAKNLSLVLLAALLIAGMPSHVFAEDYPPPTLSLPDTDTTPVEFSVGGIKYRIPRNYLTTMDSWKGGPQKLVTLVVNVPDLKPFSQETMTCFTEKDILRKAGCDPFTFEIDTPGTVSAEKVFADSRSMFHSQKPAKGPFGYDKYEAGMEDARLEYYRKTIDGRTYMYACQVFDNEGKRDGICETLGNKATSGPVLHYYFALYHLADIDQIDASLRNMVESFTIGRKE